MSPNECENENKLDSSWIISGSIILPPYLQGNGSRSHMDTKIHGCSSPLWKTVQLALGICRFSVHRFHQRQIDIFKTFTLFLVALDFIAACRLSLVAESWGCSSLQCVGSSLQCLLLLWSTGSRCTGFSSCSTWAE